MFPSFLGADQNNIFFEDHFERPDSPVVGNGWLEAPSSNSDITLEGGRVRFENLSSSLNEKISFFRGFPVHLSNMIDQTQLIVKTTIRYGNQVQSSNESVALQIEGEGSSADGDQIVVDLIYSNSGELTLCYTRDFFSMPLLTLTATSNVSIAPQDIINQDHILEIRARPSVGSLPAGYDGYLYQKGTALPLVPQVSIDITTPHASLVRAAINLERILPNSVVFVDDFVALNINRPTIITIVDQIPSTMGPVTGITVTDLNGINNSFLGPDLSTFDLKINGSSIFLSVEDCIALGLCSPIIVTSDGLSASFLIFFDLSHFCVEASVSDFFGIQYSGDNKP